ncbi:MAG TPA: glycosyltransferase [Aggregatilineales bacterium]|nr:glycosyltransferase [Aggregatilineales bacterium]
MTLTKFTRIAHIAKMTSVAGMERHLLFLLPGLHGQGLDVHLFVLVEPNKPLAAYCSQMSFLGVPVEQIPIRRDLDPGLIGRLARKLRDGGFDAVHTHLIHADLHGVAAAKLAGVRHIYSSAHNDDSFRRRWPIRLMQAELWRQVQGGIAISEALRHFLIEVEFAPPARIHTVHYGLDPASVDGNPAGNPGSAQASLRERLGLPTNTHVVGSVCRLTRQKGVTYALQALQRLPDVHYAIVGDGPLRNTLENEARTLGIAGRVHFLGWRDNAASLLTAFDVLLMPSLWEGFGLIALEAMAAHLPIIASRVSALPEIVMDGQTGGLVPPADPTALREALSNVLADSQQRQAMGQAGYRRLREAFSVQRMVEATLKVYNNL